MALKEAEACERVRGERSSNEGWLSFRGTADGVHGLSLERPVLVASDSPHDYSIEDVPGGSDDGGATAEPCNALNIFAVDEVTSPPLRIGPFDIENTPGGPAGPAGSMTVGWLHQQRRGGAQAQRPQQHLIENSGTRDGPEGEPAL